MFLKKAIVFLMALTAAEGRDTQWYKFPNRRIGVVGIKHDSTTAFQDAAGLTFSKGQFDVHSGTSTTGELLHTIVNPVPKLEAGSTAHTISTVGGEIKGGKINYFFFDFFLEEGTDSYLQGVLTDAAGISYSGGGNMKFNTDSGEKTINFTFTSAASPAVTTTFTMTYRVFDTSYTVGPDYEEIAMEVVVKLQD